MASDPTENGNVGRRSFLAASAAGAMVAATAPSALATPGSPLRAGADLGGGWVAVAVTPVEAGSIRVVAEHAATARRANVALCRAEGGSRALASTGALDLFLMNDGGDGKRLTPDDEVALVQRLAQRLTGAEETVPGVARLMGRAARQASFDPIDHLEPLARD